MLCFSLPVHEQPDVIVNQVENIRHYLPDAFIVLHLSLAAFELRSELRQRLAAHQNVFINPRSYPTCWGWMFHAHLINFQFAKNLGIPFTHFVMDTSNSLFFRAGAEKQINRYAALHDCEELAVREARYKPGEYDLGIRAQREDRYFRKMIKDLGINDLRVSTHEGMSYRVELFEEMMKIFERFYLFDALEYKYPREDIYFSTISWHLTKEVGTRLTYFFPHAWTQEAAIETVNSLLHEANLNPNANSQYAIKPVPREMVSPLRRHINSLVEPQES